MRSILPNVLCILCTTNTRVRFIIRHYIILVACPPETPLRRIDSIEPIRTSKTATQTTDTFTKKLSHTIYLFIGPAGVAALGTLEWVAELVEIIMHVSRIGYILIAAMGANCWFRFDSVVYYSSDSIWINYARYVFNNSAGLSLRVCIVVVGHAICMLPHSRGLELCARTRLRRIINE